MIVIYKPDGTPLFGTDTNGDPIPLQVGDDSQRVAELMGDDILTLRFSLPEHTAFPLRSWCEFEGKRYYLYKSPEITKQHNRNFEYVMPMFTSDYMLKITMMRNRTYNRSTGVYEGDLRLKFPLTATPREHLEMVAACLNDAETEPNAEWAVDYSKTLGMTAANNGAHTNYDGTKYNDGGDEELVSYEFNYCIDAIRNQATAFNTEYEIADAIVTSGGTTTVYHLLSLHDVEYNKSTPLYMSYGKGNGFKSGIARKNESDLPPVDRLYIQGGEQNIPTHYGMKATTVDGVTTYTEKSPNYIKSNTLLLPKNVACFCFRGCYYFAKPSENRIVTDNNRNRVINEMNAHDPVTGDAVHEVLYDSDGNLWAYNDEDGNQHLYQLLIGTPCYLTSADGRSVERVRHTYYDPDYTPRGTKVESFYDASEIYPMRVGGVSQVQTINRQRKVDDGQGGTTMETYKLYDIIDALADCPDYSQCSIDGETMTVIFQDGMLAGREFNLNTTESGVVICTDVTVLDDDDNPIPARKLELCPSDQDGYTMPNETFAPRPGDHYIAFHCSLPEEYVSGIAYGAEFRALKEMVRYLHDHGKETFTFSGSVDTLWVKRVWDDYVERYTGSPYNMNIPHSEYFNLGQHIKVTDVQLFGSQGLVMRVTGIKQPVNSPRSIELTLTNAIVLKYNWVKQLSQTVQEVRLRKRPRPLNPFFPRGGVSITDDVIAEEMLDANGNLLDLRRKFVTPMSLFGSIVGLNATSGLRGTVGTLNTYTRQTLVSKINEYRTALQSAQTQLQTIQSRFNTLRNALVDANGKVNGTYINGIGDGQCSVIDNKGIISSDDSRDSYQSCTYSNITITIPDSLVSNQ